MKKWARQSEDKATWRVAVILATSAVVAIGLVGWHFGTYKVAPNVLGQSLDQAATTLHQAGIDIDIGDAEGTVTDQEPIGGERLFRYNDFVLTYTNETGTHVIGGPESGE